LTIQEGDQVGSSRDLLAKLAFAGGMNLPYALRAEVIQLEYGGVLGLWGIHWGVVGFTALM
jgi:hypothetical protein